MHGWRSETKACFIGSALLLSMFSFQNDASASSIYRQGGAVATQGGARGTQVASGPSSQSRYVGGRHVTYAMAYGRHASAYRGRGISCVPYARQVSGIEVPGNAWQWWGNAAGEYARGKRPEAGSVLAFRANGRMRLGHVAVVAKVVNAREVLIDHANWGGGGISRGVAVVDVSEANDWSAVRVQLANRGEFGSVYPTYGFIYNRPDSGAGVVIASAVTPAPMPAINPAPSDLRPVAERPWRAYEEVAQSPRTPHRRLDLRVSPAGRAD